MIKNIFSSERELFLSTYNRIPIEISYGKGVHLFDKKGNRYLDMFSGLGVNALGYSHPEIIKAVSSQISCFGHLSNNFITDIQVLFARQLLKYSQMDKAFLTNSGTEAIETAIKIIRKIKGPTAKIFSFTNSFHGRTYGAMTLTSKSKYQKGFEPLLPNIHYLEFNNVEELKNNFDENTAGIFVEFIQGEGGINLVSDEYINELKKLRSRFDFILAADEIQSGVGRTGKPFAFNYHDIKPDIITTAKAIGGGLPLGAAVVKSEFKDVFEIGKHGTTFGGNPVSCAAGLVVLNEVFENGLMNQANSTGRYLNEQLLELKILFPEQIKDIRGKGLMIGIEMFYECSKLVEKLREKRILANCTNSNVIRLLPPLIISKNEIDFFLFSFHEVLKEINANDIKN
jgi:predicted acetylornithine/succinylornithine family transaminase